MDGLVIYPQFPEKIRRIYDYDVSVTCGERTERLPVYNHVIESNVSRRPGVDMYRRFSAFAFSGCSVRVDIKVKTDFECYTVFPSAKKFRHSFKDGVISVYLDKAEYFGVQLDDDQNSIISVLPDEIEKNVPSENDKNVIYINGWYAPESGKLDIDRAGTTLYIAPGAVLNARVKITAPNCTVTGRGALVDPFENLYLHDIRDGGKEARARHMIDIVGDAHDCLVDGPFILDARTYNFICEGRDNLVRNLKELSAMMTSDGIGIESNNCIEHCWFYVGDNGIVSGSRRGIVAKDVTIGTTCAGLFPQCDCDDQIFEDINVFRADEGVINNFWNSEKIQRTFDNITFTRIAAVEMPDGLTHFLQGRNMGVMPKTLRFDGISIPELQETVLLDNEEPYLHTANYTLLFNNIEIGGRVTESADELTICNPENADCFVSVTHSSGFSGVKRNEKEVNFTAADKIYIGARQVFFSEIKKENGTSLFPADEICPLLRAENRFSEFVPADELISAGAIKSAAKADGALRITPVYNGENLLLPDTDEISRFAEQVCYQTFLVTNKDKAHPVYTVYANPHWRSPDSGISRRITDEIRMYGEGEYRLTFRAKGGSNGTFTCEVETDTARKSTVMDHGTEWREYSCDITVTGAEMNSTKCVIIIRGDTAPLDGFMLSDLSLTKI